MLDTCVPLCGPKFNGITPKSTGGKLPSNSYSRIVATTPVRFGLYTPMLVRKLPVADPALARLVNTVTACAADDGNPGMNIPTDPTVPEGQGGLDAGEYRRDVTTRLVEVEENSTAPSELGTLNKLTQMLSNALASRGANAKFFTGCVEQPAVEVLHRYVAVTFNTSVYDVLNTRTSEKNGAAPTTDAATGNVTVSAKSCRTTPPPRTRRAIAVRRFLEMIILRARRDPSMIVGRSGRATVDRLPPRGPRAAPPRAPPLRHEAPRAS